MTDRKSINKQKNKKQKNQSEKYQRGDETGDVEDMRVLARQQWKARAQAMGQEIHPSQKWRGRCLIPLRHAFFLKPYLV